MAPVAPVGPVGPEAPVAPVAPVTPVRPVAPVAAAPVAPKPVVTAPPATLRSPAARSVAATTPPRIATAAPPAATGAPTGSPTGAPTSALASGPEVELKPEARKALLNIEHEQAVSKANFAKPYDDSVRATPLGAEPLLVMDEPTNHMDMESIEALNTALDKYKGTLFFVSHDREFVSSLATRIIDMKPTGIVDFKGNYEEYLRSQGIDG